jgi:chemotaxis protein methyltransferase CheR
MTGSAALSPAQFQRLAGLIEAKVGIHFSPAKHELLAARLSKRMRALGVEDSKAYLRLAQEDADEERRLLDQVTTNQTYFWREPEHFSHLMAWARQHAERPAPKALRLWCAACSSGEEAWTMAMAAAEAVQGRCEIKVLASDLSDRMLEKAVAGRYDNARVKLLPTAWKQRWFRQEAGGHWSATAELRSMLSFARLNLMELPQAPTGLDAVFCRNVMIYFDRPVQTQVVADLSQRLRPQGYLYTGMAESLLAIPHGLENRAPSVYQRPA